MSLCQQESRVRLRPTVIHLRMSWRDLLHRLRPKDLHAMRNGILNLLLELVMISEQRAPAEAYPPKTGTEPLLHGAALARSAMHTTNRCNTFKICYNWNEQYVTTCLVPNTTIPWDAPVHVPANRPATPFGDANSFDMKGVQKTTHGTKFRLE